MSYVSTDGRLVPLGMPILVFVTGEDTPAPSKVSNNVTIKYSNNVMRRSYGGEFGMRELSSNKYFLSSPISITIHQDYDDEYTATFSEAELSRSAETAKEAIEWLKSSIVTLYDLLKKRSPEQLGPLPLRQLRVLGKYLVEVPDSKA
jgi:hypothetical protein